MWLEVFSKVLAMSEVQHQIVTGQNQLDASLPSLPDHIIYQSQSLSMRACHQMKQCKSGGMHHTTRKVKNTAKFAAMPDKQSVHCAGGALVRGENDSRIDFLAKVRNKALEPLWKLANDNSGSPKKEAGLAVEQWKADRVIFMNDVFVCAKDFMRLLLHDVDMACGLDFGDRDKVSAVFEQCAVKGRTVLHLHTTSICAQLFSPEKVAAGRRGERLVLAYKYH